MISIDTVHENHLLHSRSAIWHAVYGAQVVNQTKTSPLARANDYLRVQFLLLNKMTYKLNNISTARYLQRLPSQEIGGVWGQFVTDVADRVSRYNTPRILDSCRRDKGTLARRGLRVRVFPGHVESVSLRPGGRVGRTKPLYAALL